MFALMKRVSRIENRIDTSIEKFVFRHRVLGFLLIIIGTPMVTLAAVCIGTAAITLPLALVFGWI